MQKCSWRHEKGNPGLVVQMCSESADSIYQSECDWGPYFGIVLGSNGNRMVRVLDMDNGSVHRRHVDQIHYHAPDTTSNTDSNPSHIYVDSDPDAH